MSGRNQAGMNRIEKYPKRCYANCGDILSSLPDGLLGDILSLLPMKDVVRTSVLSKSWKSKWTLICNPNLDENMLFPKSQGNHAIFFELVERIVFRLRCKRSFHLSCSCYGEHELSCLARWISDVLKRHKIQSLNLWIRCGVMMANNEFCILPNNLLNCNSLEDLLVDMCFTFKVPIRNHFPHLVKLKLSDVIIRNGHSIATTLTFTFPLLKKFKLYACKWLRVKLVEIYAPSLTMFNSVTEGISTYSIKISGASLKNLVLGGNYPENIILDGAAVDDAFLICWYEDQSDEESSTQLQKLLRELSHVKMLKICGRLEGIMRTEQVPPLITFSKLEKLHMWLPNTGEVLLELLHSAPFLKSLELIFRDGDDYGDYNEYDYDEDNVLVPSCLESYLEDVILDYGDCYEEPKFYLAKFLLEKGLQLKNVKVIGSPDLPANEIVNCLSIIRRGSTLLNIQPTTRD